MSDRLKQAQERWTDIKLDWGLRDSPDDVEVRLAAVVRWLDSASSDRTVPLRATQILLLDPEAPGASRRAVVRHVYKALGGSWLSPGGEALHLLQAMILAGCSEHASGPFELVGLMGAGWEVMQGREAFRESSEAWRRFEPASLGVRGAAVLTMGQAAAEAPAVSSVAPIVEDTQKKAAYEALKELRTNAQTGWNYSGYSEKLLGILGYIDSMVRHFAAGDKSLVGKISGVAPNLKQLQDWQAVGHAYNGFSGQLIPWMEAVIQVLSDLRADLVGLQAGWITLKTHAGQGWNFDGLSIHLLPVLDALLHAVTRLQDRQSLTTTIQSVNTALQQQSAHFNKTLSSLSTQLPAALESARPDEVELLWWGQARYCHTYGKPFRSLLKAPGERTQALYAAIRETADRSWRLNPEPAAAYLVEILSGFGFDVDASRPIAAWLREFAAHRPPDNAPDGPLAALAADDAVGLPVTWARLHPRFTEDDAQIATSLALPVDAEIDLGTWATWILRERVLELRMRS